MKRIKKNVEIIENEKINQKTRLITFKEENTNNTFKWCTKTQSKKKTIAKGKKGDKFFISFTKITSNTAENVRVIKK